MADCRIVNQNVANSVENIKGYAAEYAAAGDALQTAFMGAISDMEGDTKDALVELFDKKYKEFVTTQISEMINGLATLLDANRTNFESVDEQIAQSIRDGANG